MGNKSRYKSSSIFDMQFITSSISTTLVLLLLGLVVSHPVRGSVGVVGADLAIKAL